MHAAAGPRRRIGVITVARSDYGLLRPVLQRILAAADLELQLLVSGMHLSPEFGSTVQEIEADGFPIAERIEMLLSSDRPEGIARAMGLGAIGFAQAYARSRPDLLLFLGDRFEVHAAAAAALPFGIPLAHIHGGEVTEGAIDEAFRHSLTKMAHLHFASTELYARRILQLGEEPWRVTVSGAPGLDNLRGMQPLERPALEALLGLELAEPPLLVTFHPVTTEVQRTGEHVDALLAALARAGRKVVFTHPCADAGGRLIIQKIQAFVAAHPGQAALTANLGTRSYFGLMALAAAMVGNSSSGIIEAASFELPVVNIGTRQRGRVRGANVIDVDGGVEAIAAAIDRAISPAFRAGLRGMVNPYGDGRAAERIVERLQRVPLDERLLVKKFVDLPRAGGAAAAGAAAQGEGEGEGEAEAQVQEAGR